MGSLHADKDLILPPLNLSPQPKDENPTHQVEHRHEQRNNAEHVSPHRHIRLGRVPHQQDVEHEPEQNEATADAHSVGDQPCEDEPCHAVKHPDQEEQVQRQPTNWEKKRKLHSWKLFWLFFKSLAWSCQLYCDSR